MSELLVKIKQEQLKARVERDSLKASVLTTLVGEIETLTSRDKNIILTDADVLKLINKFISNNIETYQLTKNQNCLAENNYLSLYLPKQLSERELKAYIALIIDTNSYTSKKDMGKVMQELKSKYSGQFDSRLVIKLIEQALQ